MFKLDKVSDEPFNVSTATDQQLANEYRRLREEQRPVFDELRRRGYSINLSNGFATHFGKEVKIIKQQTVSL
jgi:hypothetical protein